jgi:CRP-like cAMP-binding protein
MSALKNFELLGNLSDEQIQRIEAICYIEDYDEGEFILREGEKSTDLYFLVEGKVAIYQTEPNTLYEIAFREREAGSSFGEMAFLDGSQRSSSVRAVLPCKVYVLSRKDLIDELPDYLEVLSVLNTTITCQVTDSLRQMSRERATIMQKQIDKLAERNEFGQFFIRVIILILLLTLANSYLNDLFDSYSPYSIFFNWTYILIAGIAPLLLFLRKSTLLSWPDVGVTRQNWRQSAIEGLLISALGILVIVGLAWLQNSGYPSSQTLLSLLNISVPLTAIFYLICSVFQEFVRATVQVALQRFLPDQTGYVAVLVTAVVIAISQAFMGSQAILMTLIAFSLFGFVYLRTKNIIGPTIVHFIVGFLTSGFSYALL